MKRVVAVACGAAIVVLALGAMTARADERHGGARAEHRAEHFDERYSHNHYYPGRGGYVRAVPGRPFILERGGGRYFYSGGVWYAPDRASSLWGRPWASSCRCCRRFTPRCGSADSRTTTPTRLTMRGATQKMVMKS